MVQCLASTLRRRDGNVQVLFYLFLSDELSNAARPEAGVKGSIFRAGLA